MTKTTWVSSVALGVLGLCGAAFAADMPGQKFHVTPASLAKPYATPAVANDSRDVSRAPNEIPMVPQGFKVSIYAEKLSNARTLAVAPNGDVFVAEPSAGKVTLLRDTKNAGKADQSFTFVSGMARPHGLALQGGYLWIGDTRGVWRVPYKDGDTKPSAQPVKFTKAADLAPRNGHWSRNIAFGPDGALYLALGSRDNVSDFKPGAQVFKIDAQGNMAEFASGIRNPVGIAFQPGTNNLFVSVNERDGLGDGLVPDYLTSVKLGGFYGYPYSYIGQNPDPDWAKRAPAGKIASAIVPDVLFQAHSAPTGLVFYTGSNFPAEYKNDAFVSLHGSWNASKQTGYKVVRVHFVNGKPEGGYENFATGFWPGKEPAGQPARTWGRPEGLAVARDGSLLIADDVANVIWRVRYEGGPAR